MSRRRGVDRTLETALRYSRNPCPCGDRKDAVARLHPAYKLGCIRASKHGASRDARCPGSRHIIRGEITIRAVTIALLAGSVCADPRPIRGTASQTPDKATAQVSSPDCSVLSKRNLAIPVPGVDRKNILDTFNESRTGARRHEATDILAPRESPVIAVDAGPVKKLFLSVRGGLTVYQFDGSATYCYYYAHLDHYAKGLHEGQILKRGDLIGYVGTSGNARSDNSHLHFAIFKLGPEKEWWKGVPINPYPVLLHLCGCGS